MLSLVEEQGLLSSWKRAQWLPCPGFSCCGLWAQVSRSVWELRSLTRDRTHVPCIGRWLLQHWATKKVPMVRF